MRSRGTFFELCSMLNKPKPFLIRSSDSWPQTSEHQNPFNQSTIQLFKQHEVYSTGTIQRFDQYSGTHEIIGVPILSPAKRKKHKTSVPSACPAVPRLIPKDSVAYLTRVGPEDRTGVPLPVGAKTIPLGSPDQGKEGFSSVSSVSLWLIYPPYPLILNLD